VISAAIAFCFFGFLQMRSKFFTGYLSDIIPCARRPASNAEVSLCVIMFWVGCHGDVLFIMGKWRQISFPFLGALVFL